MSDTREKFRARMAAATQKDVVLGVFLEAALGKVALLKGASEEERMRAEVLDRRTLVSFFRYPALELLTIVDSACADARSDSEFFDKTVSFGVHAVEVFYDSPVGRTMKMLAGTNPHRLLSSVPGGYKATVSFGDRNYRRLSDREAAMDFKGDLLGPGWAKGVFQEGISNPCEVSVDVQVEEMNDIGTDFTLRMKW